MRPKQPFSLDLEAQVGQMLVAGFPGGEEGFATYQTLVSQTKIGNCIFFTRNVTSLEGTRRLTDRVRDLIQTQTGIEPLISIDQEGGMVSRIVDGVVPIPGPMALAAAYLGKRLSLDQVKELGATVGRELLALGFNWNLAPDADVNINPLNPVIGTRSFGEDPRLVGKLASAFAQGIQSTGVLACAKHFPGHGDTSTDSHLGLPRVDFPRRRLEKIEFVPFKKLIKAGVDSIMSAHILFPALEPDELPATLSSRILRDFLRNRWKFRGLIVTDCLEMKAIHGRYGQAPVQAVLAGADLIFVSHSADLQRLAHTQIVEAVHRGEIPRSRIEESVARILERKSRLPRVPSPAVGTGWLLRPESLDLAVNAARSSLTLLPGKPFPQASTGRLVYLDIKAQAITNVEEDSGTAPTVAQTLEATHVPVEARKISLDPRESEVKEILDFCRGAQVILGLYGLQTAPGQQKLVAALAQALAGEGKTLALVSFRSPYDLGFARNLAQDDQAPALCAWEYTAPAVRAVADFVAGRSQAPGVLPVTV